MKHHKSRPGRPSPVEEQIRRAQAEGAFDDNEAIQRLDSGARHGPPSAVSPLDVEAEIIHWRAERTTEEED
jgi:hypothetical protein